MEFLMKIPDQPLEIFQIQGVCIRRDEGLHAGMAQLAMILGQQLCGGPISDVKDSVHAKFDQVPFDMLGSFAK